MKMFVISAGNFTESGNFSGYTADNSEGRVHFHKRQMEAIGWATQEDVKFPFFAVARVTQIGQLDENGDPKLNTEGKPVLIDRLTAQSLFKSEDELIGAKVSAATLEMKVNQAIAKVVITQKVELAAFAKTSGLTEKAIEALVAASI